MRKKIARIRRVSACLSSTLLCFTSLATAVPPVLAAAAGTMAPDSRVQANYTPMGTLQAMGFAPFPCQQTVPAQCLGPDQVRAAYGIQPVVDGGLTGAGRTIVIVDAFQSPTLESDLATFDAIWHLPPVPHFSVLYPQGATPFNPADPIQIGWALEIAADVEWAHAIAPGASIDLVLAPGPSDVELLAAVKYAVDHRLGDVISQSFSEAEQCAPRGFLAKQHAVFARAVARGITVLASSGDQGATQPTCDGASLLGVRAVATPASDPDVTAVGGTLLATAGAAGTYLAERAWPAGGGGFSAHFERSEYQATAQSGSHARGVPDVAYDAGVPVIVVWSLLAPPGNPGLGAFGGTSIGPPQWAAMVAIADQRAGHRLGLINPALYHAARRSEGAFHDVVAGNNSFGGVVGFAAGPGWDAATGLGTPNFGVLIRDLARGDDD